MRDRASPESDSRTLEAPENPGDMMFEAELEGRVICSTLFPTSGEGVEGFDEVSTEGISGGGKGGGNADDFLESTLDMFGSAVLVCPVLLDDTDIDVGESDLWGWIADIRLVEEGRGGGTRGGGARGGGSLVATGGDDTRAVRASS